MAMPCPEWEEKFGWSLLSADQKRERIAALESAKASTREWLQLMALESDYSSLRFEIEDRAAAAIGADPELWAALAANLAEDEDKEERVYPGLCNCGHALELDCGMNGCSSGQMVSTKRLMRRLRAK